MTDSFPYKVVMGPVNIAGQPYQLVRGLRKKGIDVRLLQLQFVEGHRFEYHTDEKVIIDPLNRVNNQFDVIKRCLEEDIDIFHFWLRSFVYGKPYTENMGIDLPLYRQYGRRVVYRFTGFDLRTKSQHVAKNPYHPWRYGYELEYDEDAQHRYIDFVREHADLIIVQDPEMHEYCPEAAIIPRVLNLSDFPYIGCKLTDNPLIVHAPSNEAVKGTFFVREAIETLRNEGLLFEYREITNLPNNEALEIYKQADIIIDQLNIGWHGVLAVEAMALGKPVICYIREDIAPANLPIINANPDTIKSVLRAVIKDNQLRIETGGKGREYVERIHDVNIVADKLIKAYRTLPNRKLIVNKYYPSLEYFKLQQSKINADISYLSARVHYLEKLKDSLDRNLYFRIMRGAYRKLKKIKGYFVT